MKEFELDQRLFNDTITLAEWPLCRVLLMNDRAYPWFILVPRLMRDDSSPVKELYELSDLNRLQLDKESMHLARSSMALFNGDKMNIAALGNVVSQLHIHHVVRHLGDPAWPAPVWGKAPAQAYTEDEITALKERLAPLLNLK
jgi:diadenosine tetraphosphate (Ap4A) HIT family hydrolase